MTLRRALIGGGILLVLAMVITIALLVGIVLGRGEQVQGEGGADAGATVAQAAEDGDSDKQAPDTDDETSSGGAVGQGETLEYADRTVTLNNVERGYLFPSGYPRPTPGREFVIANVSIVNKSTQPIPANSYNFESEDSKGARVRAQATQVPPDAIFIGSLAPKGELTGNLIFEVEQDDPTIRVVYRPGP